MGAWSHRPVRSRSRWTGGPADDPSAVSLLSRFALNDPVEMLGPREEWLVEWKWTASVRS